MTYRANCPSCGHKFGRLWFFRGVPEYRHTCPTCGARIKSNSWWEWIGSAVLALPVLVALGLWHFWRFPGWAVLLVTAVMLAVGVAFFPYLTKFDLKDDTKDHAA